MITELLILFILINQASTIYKIKKNIDLQFFLFHSASMGTIYPVLQKLYSSGYVAVKKSMSSRGQKSSVYSITGKGKKYFEELLIQDLPENPSLSAQVAKIKILLLPQLEKSHKIAVINLLKNYCQNRFLDLKNYQEDNKENKNLNINYIKFLANAISEEINWLKFQELN